MSEKQVTKTQWGAAADGGLLAERDCAKREARATRGLLAMVAAGVWPLALVSLCRAPLDPPALTQSTASEGGGK
jgi:hypothetical protein